MRIPEIPPPFHELLSSLKETKLLAAVLSTLTERVGSSRYFHWDELKHRKGPDGFSREQWWLALKLRRLGIQQQFVPLQDKKGARFSFSAPDVVAELLHHIDRDGGTLIQMPAQVTSPVQRDRYLVRSLMEEAITSSQLEGAATTREVAKKMLTEGRAPRDRSERMILNNFNTMRRIIEWKDRPLTPELLLEIHRQLSEDALDVKDGAGRFRRSDESIEISDIEGTVFHVPPDAEELEKRVTAMCAFANGETHSGFVHPVLRGIILHFWLAYDHPFVDGNGRTARALFYWQMLRAGYWLFEFVSISQFLRKSPGKYGLAFLHTETDDNDLTYFIIHQAGVIREALKELHDYVAEKSTDLTACTQLLRGFPGLNHRQQSIISHAIRNPGFQYSVAGHMTSHGTAYDTARNDLLALAGYGLLDQGKVGKAHSFSAPLDLKKRLSKGPE